MARSAHAVLPSLIASGRTLIVPPACRRLRSALQRPGAPCVACISRHFSGLPCTIARCSRPSARRRTVLPCDAHAAQCLVGSCAAWCRDPVADLAVRAIEVAVQPRRSSSVMRPGGARRARGAWPCFAFLAAPAPCSMALALNGRVPQRCAAANGGASNPRTATIRSSRLHRSTPQRSAMTCANAVRMASRIIDTPIVPTPAGWRARSHRPFL